MGIVLRYLDPGSGSILLQLLVAGLAAIGLALGTRWSRIKRFWGRKKNPAEAEENEEDDEE
ncbi:MAG: hypothetical protein JXB85_07420 [Anaerolineales bacterium]|nr:hypothetical protein [Anaerolineales bacterium]